MDLGGINLGEIWTTVGGVLGTPAAIFLFWTYSKVNDLANNVYVYDVEYSIRQHAIANPTNGNLVAMDASGLVKDSGVAVLPSTSTWDGTSDAKVPTAKAVQANLDAISTAVGAEAEVTTALWKALIGAYVTPLFRL